MSLALTLIRQAEGCRLAAYDDATGDPVPDGGSCRGTLTIGYGHTGADVTPGLVWTQQQADDALTLDAGTACADALACVGAESWSGLDDVRRAALTDAAFTLGRTRLMGFERMLEAVRRRNFGIAATEMLNSRWAVEAPARAQRDAMILRTGQYP